ncbi:recombination protein NinB [Pararhizobium antarcticum]|uniref:Recombinase n=1 Tax=Pararhizobium antarcticum TaxID=1798805 RepID=A0A657LUQ0_9HYPH|nr:recombination protein NinB [Pararhizobium antarcticum]OJF97614.1 recombinase [Pararhizobium antarcticum]
MAQEKKTFVLINEHVRGNAMAALMKALPDFTVTIAPKQRSNDQSAKLHAILGDLARSPLTWAGKRRTLEEWKMIVISGHAVATGHSGEVIPGLEGEFVAIRESSASMSVSRASSLIEYLLAFCGMNNVELTETCRRGFMDERFGSDRHTERRAS